MTTGESVGEWYDEHGEAILTYIFLMVRDYQQAEDLTQETFIKAFRKYHTFSFQSSFKTWLFSIATNTTKDYMRKSKLSENPDEQMIQDIKRAIREFMASKEAKEAIQDNPYEIELLSKSKKVLLKVTNEEE